MSDYNCLSVEDYERFADERDYPLYDDEYWEDEDDNWRSLMCSDDEQMLTEHAFRDAWWRYADTEFFEDIPL